ncbi:hypothetical protein IPO96_01415 [Candidatus Saccharibacteria bacterium]|jgi:hypothetical protein|nr:MAG: hypothetical protein IPO96_01415 [Candidatus Saccharibacteria bacterium]
MNCLPEVCPRCTRNGRDEGWSDDVYKAAAGKLLEAAAEVSIADELEAIRIGGITPEVRGLIYESIGEQRIFFGAVLICGRRIGKGTCAEWKFDAKAEKIVSVRNS